MSFLWSRYMPIWKLCNVKQSQPIRTHLILYINLCGLSTNNIALWAELPNTTKIKNKRPTICPCIHCLSWLQQLLKTKRAVIATQVEFCAFMKPEIHLHFAMDCILSIATRGAKVDFSIKGLHLLYCTSQEIQITNEISLISLG